MALARLRNLEGTSSNGTWKTWDAVIRWISAPCFKTVDHLLVAGNVSKDTKFNLGVVSINQRAALPRDKEFAHLSPKFSANRDILDIGFGTADAAGTGFCLVEGGVDPTVRLYRTGQADDIGAQQFGQLAIIQNLFDNGGAYRAETPTPPHWWNSRFWFSFQAADRDG